MHMTKKQADVYLLLFAALLAGLAVWRWVGGRNAPGGYPQLFYEGRLYVGEYTGLQELPQGWTLCGTVTEEIAGSKKPKENGQCNWFPVGTEIYANANEPDTVYLYAVLKYFRYDVKN